MTRSFPNSSLVAYPGKGKLAAFPVSPAHQLFVYNARAFNNTGGAINVGIMKLLSAAEYTLYQYVNTGPVYTKVTAAALAAGVNIFDTTNNDGFALQANSQFGMVGFTISAASAGGTYTYKYWNGAWTTLPTLEVPVYSSTGDVWIVFVPPTDWIVGGDAALNQAQYSILVQATTHPTTAVAVNADWVAQFLEFYEGVPNNAAVQLSFPDSKPLLLNGGEGLIPYFSSTNAANQFGCYYALNG